MSETAAEQLTQYLFVDQFARAISRHLPKLASRHLEQVHGPATVISFISRRIWSRAIIQ